MVNRLRLSLTAGTPALKLSKPGVDVDAAAATDLLFDGVAAGYSGVLLSGIVPFSSFAVSTQANFYGYTNYYRYDLALGRTFPSPPKIAIAVNDPILGTGYFGPRYNPDNTSFDNISGTGFHGSSVGIGAESTVNTVSLYMSAQYYDGTQWPYPATMSFVVYFT